MARSPHRLVNLTLPTRRLDDSRRDVLFRAVSFRRKNEEPVPPSLQNYRRFLASFKMVSWRTSVPLYVVQLTIICSRVSAFTRPVFSPVPGPPASSLTRSSSSPPFQSASGVARLSGCCDSTRLLIIRPPTPLHHPSSHTVASLVLPYRCIIRPPTPLHHLHHLHHLGSILAPLATRGTPPVLPTGHG